MPSLKDHFLLLDAGANVDCKPLHLHQFAVMGEAYAKFIFNIDKPRVGLLSIGEEDAKGNELTKEAFKLIKSSNVNFIGNIEGRTYSPVRPMSLCVTASWVILRSR